MVLSQLPIQLPALTVRADI